MLPGAIFDMDGTMFDTEAIWQKNWRILAKKYGYEPSDDFGREVSGTSGDSMMHVIRKYYPKVVPQKFYEEERAMCYAEFEQGVPLKEGLFDILDLLRGQHVRMAVASSSPIDLIIRNLKSTGTESYFAAVVSSKMVTHAKPAPDVFLEAARRLYLPPERCYVFEDSFGGVRAGFDAGCTTVMIPDTVQPDDEIRSMASAVYTSLSEAAMRIADGSIGRRDYV